ncbi:MAG: cysteine--tRNA ligase [Euryarchaeota archaeon]|nr:cysteine--tRNA ligase [Euryarchaeota archaeon]
MTLRVQNTMTGKLDDFTPVNPGRVGMYVCGINTYDDSHMGHAKSAVTFDVIRRHLERRGYAVKYVVNFTDVEDHCIQRANELGISLDELAKKYIAEYFKDMRALGVRDADEYPVASHHIPEMREAIKKLIADGFAYASMGSVYFKVSKVKEYGKLSHQSLDDMQSSGRVDSEEGKEDPMDFALWKAWKPGEPSWDSPWGKGRPGWHIECSVMSMKYLGETLDIHGGGSELVFPHHENELMQSESLTGKPFVKYWLHGGLMNVGAEKMSKSLGNFFTIKDVLKLYEPGVVRFFLLNTHYRKPIDFNDKALDEAKLSLARIRSTWDRLRDTKTAEHPNPDLWERAKKARADFEAAMDEDFNTRGAVAAVFELLRDINKALDEGKVCEKAKEEAIALFGEFDRLFGVLAAQKAEGDDMLAPLMHILVELREDARKRKDFKAADLIRDRLKALGIAIEDSAGGAKWKYTKKPPEESPNDI